MPIKKSDLHSKLWASCDELRGGMDATRKAIKHVHLSVLPPAGKVRVAAPQIMPLDTIRLFVVSKLGWISSQQRKLQAR